MFNLDLPKIGMTTDKKSVYLQPRSIKDCNPGVGEFEGLAEPKSPLHSKDYRPGAQKGKKKTGDGVIFSSF